jgi:hypothetical protein
MTDDRRRTVCKKWRNIDGKRTPCSFLRGHAGLCSWAVKATGDGNPARDVGPFHTADQVMAQFTAWSATMLVPDSQAAMLSLWEGALMAGIVPTPFETEYLDTQGVDPIAATILSGWLLRARLAGPAVVRPVLPGDV